MFATGHKYLLLVAAISILLAEPASRRADANGLSGHSHSIQVPFSAHSISTPPHMRTSTGPSYYRHVQRPTYQPPGRLQRPQYTQPGHPARSPRPTVAEHHTEQEPIAGQIIPAGADLEHLLTTPDGVELAVAVRGFDLGSTIPGVELQSATIDGEIFSPTGQARLIVRSDTSITGLPYTVNVRDRIPPDLTIEWELRQRVNGHWTDWLQPDLDGQQVGWVVGHGEPLPQLFQLRIRVASQYMQRAGSYATRIVFDARAL